MTDLREQVADLVRECHQRSAGQGVPSRPVAVRMVNDLEDGPLLRRLAAEFLVDAIARAERAKTLEAERAAERERQRQQAEEADSPSAAERRRRWEAEREDDEIRSWQMMYGVIGKALDRYAEDLRVQWTAELLDSSFTLADGTRVTWGEATAEQHAERRQMFLNNAHANMEGAARHEVALRELRESGRQTLRELMRAAA